MSAVAALENESLKPMRGWVNSFYKTYKGKRLGPYHVRRWKVGRKVHREYIKPEDVERVKAACQAHREGRRNVRAFLDNFVFLGKMMDGFDTGKIVSPAMGNYIVRLRHEGMHITGRPPMRRRITRHLVKVGGETMIVKTVFELDGTTKVFMVPFVVKNPLDRMKEIFDQVVAEVFGGKKRPGRPRKHQNRWFSPQL